MVAAHDGERYAWSVQEVPTFEGGIISIGMRAEEGATVRTEVRADRSIRAHTIGSVKAKGICGTGLFEALGALVDAGVVGKDGTIKEGDGRVTLARGVELLQLDIRELQLAKGALRTATKILCKTAGIRDRDLASVEIAGAFGAHLNHELAVRLKMLPDVEASVVRTVGNASLEGATIFAMDPEGSRARLADIRARTRHVELATREDFQELFVESLGF